MGKINILDKALAEKIAAGEVVERPSSVIKELVENSIDSGASSITVEIKHGGTLYMRVCDNGSGMDYADAQKAFLRHATSKIKTAADLYRIGTLGFRGEALCSIGAVSKTELFTKQLTSDEGTHIVINGGELEKSEGAGCPDGTTIVVRDLFFNTPARLKFLKKDASEAAAVLDVCQKQALSHPDISVRVIRDGKEVLFTPGDSILKNAVHSVFGRDIAENTTEVDYRSKAVHIYGLAGKNNLSRPNRLMQIFFINGRYVANKILSAALTEAYKNELMTGKFPVAILNIEIDPSLVDVNVHPAKTEVKFADERSVYDSVYWAVKNALSRQAAPREAVLPKNLHAYEMPSSPAVKEQISFSAAKPAAKFTPITPSRAPKSIPVKPTISQVREEVKGYVGVLPVKEIETIDVKEEPPAPKTPELQKEPETENARETVPQKEHPSAQKESLHNGVRIIGQLFNTYILLEGEGEFILIDQHAAHERINYEKLLAQKGGAEHQLLLMPITVTLTPSEKALALENEDFLSKIGFEIEDFGQNSIIIRSLAADCPFECGEDLFVEILQMLSGGQRGETSRLLERALYTVACKSAIKANNKLSVSEMEQIYRRVAELEGISTCPHGRPISIKLTKYQIEKMFGRIV